MSLGLKGKAVLILGLGRTGCSTAAALLDDEVKVFLWDDNAQSREKSDVVILCDSGARLFSEEHIGEIDLVVKSPGVPYNQIFIEKLFQSGVKVMGDVDLLYRREPRATFIGVTGTNGKSTTTALIGHVLEQSGKNVAVGGNIGQAALSLPTGKDIYVLEMSSYQLESMEETRFSYGVIVNLTPDHLPRHGTMQAYLEAKARIFKNQQVGDVAVVGTDSFELASYVVHHPHMQTVKVGSLQGDICVNSEGVLFCEGKKISSLSHLKQLPGQHNWQNIACAYSLLRYFVSDEEFLSALTSFKSLPHRMELVCEIEGVSFYNDSKATNPASVNPALDSLDSIYWIVGGQQKDEGILPCLSHLKNVKAAFVIGEVTEEFSKELQSHVQTFSCQTLQSAMEKAWNEVLKDSCRPSQILLAPACASWDQFESFEHRGDVFASLAQEIKNREVNRV